MNIKFRKRNEGSFALQSYKRLQCWSKDQGTGILTCFQSRMVQEQPSQNKNIIITLSGDKLLDHNESLCSWITNHTPGTVPPSIHILFHSSSQKPWEKVLILSPYSTRKKLKHWKDIGWPKAPVTALDVNPDRQVPEPYALLSDATEFICNFKTGP